MKTSAVLKSANVTARQLDWWAENGITHPKLRKSGHRDYGEKDLLTIRLLSELRRRNVPLWKARQALADWRRRAGAGDFLLVTQEGRGRVFQTAAKLIDYLSELHGSGIVIDVSEMREACRNCRKDR